MVRSKKNRSFLYTIIAILFIGVLYFFFNQSGLLKFIKLNKEISSLNEDIKKLNAKNDALQNEIDSLKKEIPAMIEKIAREKYDMIKEGEEVIEVEEVEKNGK